MTQLQEEKWLNEIKEHKQWHAQLGGDEFYGILHQIIETKETQWTFILLKECSNCSLKSQWQWKRNKKSYIRLYLAEVLVYLHVMQPGLVDLPVSHLLCNWYIYILYQDEMWYLVWCSNILVDGISIILHGFHLVSLRG